MPEYFLSSLQILQRVFVEKSLELWFLGCCLPEVLLVEALCYSEDHVEALLRIIFAFLENSPQVVSSEATSLAGKVYFPNLNFFHEGDKIFVNVMKDRALMLSTVFGARFFFNVVRLGRVKERLLWAMLCLCLFFILVECFRE